MWVLLITLYHFTQSGRSYTVSQTYGGAYETKQLCLQAGGFLSQSASDSAPANNKRDPTDGISVSSIQSVRHMAVHMRLSNSAYRQEAFYRSLPATLPLLTIRETRPTVSA